MSSYGTLPGRPSGRRRPVALIVLAIVLGAGLSGGLLALGTLRAIGKMPAPTAAHRLPGPARVDVEGRGEWAIYLRGEDVSRSTSDCTVETGEGTPVPVERPGSDVRTNRGGTWVWVGTFEAGAAGDYTVECRSAAGADAVGTARRPDLRGFVGWLVGGILGSIVLLGAGLVTGLYLAFHRLD